MLLVKPEHNVREALASAVTKLINDLGSQSAAAERLGIPQSAVSDIANGKREPRLDTLIALREALNISLDELLQLPPVAPPSEGERKELALALLRALDVSVPGFATDQEDGEASELSKLRGAATRVAPGQSSRRKSVRPKAR